MGARRGSLRTPGADRHRAVLQLQLGHDGRRRPGPPPRAGADGTASDRSPVRADARRDDGLGHRVWRLKRDVGFWRPFQAIAAAARRQLQTHAAGRVGPADPQPAVLGYVSGHASVDGAGRRGLRSTLGEERVPRPALGQRPAAGLPGLGSIEYDAFHARIWGGLHFADAMDDGYVLGHQVARLVHRALQ